MWTPDHYIHVWFFPKLLSTLIVLKASFLVLAGISEYATTPGMASDYMYPLLSFAAEHIPKAKHQETPLYILCTAGMRVLPERYLHSISFHTEQ